jgi:hypothetical protein
LRLVFLGFLINPHNKFCKKKEGHIIMRMEEKNYAGRGTTGLAATGTALGGAALASVLSNGGGLLGNLFGGNVCHENQPVNRYELGLVQENGALKQQLALRDSQVYVDQKLTDVVTYFNGKIDSINQALASQAVQNQKTMDAFELVGEKIACCKNEFILALNRERDERCCGDNAIVNYSNATFYPKMVADVTTGTTTTAQTVYNPLPNCGRGCGC